MASLAEFDPGPPAAFAQQFASVPDYALFKEAFWYDWGPVFYRGRLDGSARLLCIASDPGATERIVGRTLVGDAGQRVQGFLGKLGLTRSYLCLNAYCYGLIPSESATGAKLLNDPQHLSWRNHLYDMARSANVQAIIAFGAQAQHAVKAWPGKAAIPVFNIPHPSSHDAAALATAWRAAIVSLRAIVTADADGSTTGANYGPALVEADYAPIPRGDLPFGVPIFVGDDRWLRQMTPPQFASASRPHPDDRHTLIWKAPKS